MKVKLFYSEYNKKKNVWEFTEELYDVDRFISIECEGTDYLTVKKIVAGKLCECYCDKIEFE